MRLIRLNLVLLSFLLWASSGLCASTANSQARAARDVLSRVLGSRASSFELTEIPKVDGKDVFIVEARDGKVFVGGSSGVALCRGAYHYIREKGFGMECWNGRRMELPPRLPDFPRTQIVSPHPLRLYFNACTFSYSTAFWQWPEWERELDWMAMHGINLPLASVGTEAIWERVWRDMGLTRKELDQYFIGPGFLPFQRMNCIDKHCGPLPSSWQKQTIKLQKRILSRMRSLGMEPLASAFTGGVPPALKRVRPDAQMRLLPEWGGMPADQAVSILDPTSPLYSEIGRRFISEWRKEFGQAKYFMADSFIESEPPVSTNRAERLRELAGYGDAVFKSITAGEPEATWFMQAWLFHYKRAFWDEESIQALFSKVPDNRMVLVDLYNEKYHGWEKLNGFFGKQWIYSVIHNFGGRTALTGHLQFYATDPIRSLTNPPAKGKQIGFGISPEGIQNNEVVYELLTDMMWRNSPVETEDWVRKYAAARYGKCPENMSQAWKALTESCYGNYIEHAVHGLQRTPSIHPETWIKVDAKYLDAVKLFLDCSSELGQSPLYKADAIELVAQVAAVRATDQLKAACDAQGQGNRALRDSHATEAFEIMERLDTLLSAHPTHRLDRWLDLAAGCATTRAEKDRYVMNARMQITYWGSPGLSDYSARLWSGLVADYYIPRWKLFFRSLDENTVADLNAWAEAWAANAYLGKVQPPKDPLGFARKLFERLKETDAPASSGL